MCRRLSCKHAEGVALTLEWSSLLFILETNSSEAATMINHDGIFRSCDACLVHEINGLIQVEREVEVKHIRHARNHVSHDLASIG